MKIKHSLPWIGLSALTLLAAFGLSYLYVQTQLDMVDVVVAKQHLDPRTLVRAEHLETIRMPRTLAKGAFVIEVKDALNMYVKIQHAIPQGSLIYRSALESLEDSIDQPALMLKAEQALMPIEVDLVKTAGKTIQKGQRIDIYGTLKVNRDVIVDRLFERVRVLSILDKNGEELTSNPKQLPKLMLVAMHESYVPLLTKMMAMGSITITPTAYAHDEEECVLNPFSRLLEHLDV